MGKRLIDCLLIWMLSATIWAAHRHWTVTDGLPTGEVQQIIELPNRQMLVNCEGVFCLSNGEGFDIIACDYSRTFRMETYAQGYGHLWQGDSLLWLHDFYRIFLFDTRIGAFRYDIEPRLNDDTLRQFAKGEEHRDTPNARQWQCIDSLGLDKNYSTMALDYQGGLWIGTRNEGIVYISPHKTNVDELFAGHPLIGLARSTTDQNGRIWRCKTNGLECEEKGKYTLYDTTNVTGLPHNRTTFIQELQDGRYLLCDSLSTIGYFLPENRVFVSLNVQLPALQSYRHFVGACPIDGQWAVVYTQNGIFMLDTEADTLALFPPARHIEQYATKYNCMLRDNEERLWVGTQNGLFVVDSISPMEKYFVQRIEGIRNNCIRSLVLDRKGRVWAGTSCGISRITPTVVNLGPEDGIPAISMMERATCLTEDGQLVFALGGSHAIRFNPDSVINQSKPLPVVITSFKVNDKETGMKDIRLKYNQNHLTFHFSSLDYAASSHTRYRYRLYPLEQEWSVSNDGAGLGTAHFMALQPGSYQFEVQSSATTDQWGETTVAEIEINPPLWLTWWAKTCYMLLIAFVAASLFHLYIQKRKRQLERKNEEKVNWLFELRSEARHQFAHSVNIEPDKITANKDEEALMQRILDAINQNMDNTEYTVDQLAREIGMSRANFYKKMQSMLGITPNEFLRNVRLKHAAHLLAETNYPVNQISLMVGFLTPRYFSQCFKKMFGVLPSEYGGRTSE